MNFDYRELNKYYPEAKPSPVETPTGERDKRLDSVAINEERLTALRQSGRNTLRF